MGNVILSFVFSRAWYQTFPLTTQLLEPMYSIFSHEASSNRVFCAAKIISTKTGNIIYDTKSDVLLKEYLENIL